MFYILHYVTTYYSDITLHLHTSMRSGLHLATYLNITFNLPCYNPQHLSPNAHSNHMLLNLHLAYALKLLTNFILVYIKCIYQPNS